VTRGFSRLFHITRVRQNHVRNTVRARPPLHRSSRDLLRSRLVASQDSRTRPLGRTRRWKRSTGTAGCAANPSSAVANSLRLGHCLTFFAVSGWCSPCPPQTCHRSSRASAACRHSTMTGQCRQSLAASRRSPGWSDTHSWESVESLQCVLNPAAAMLRSARLRSVVAVVVVMLTPPRRHAASSFRICRVVASAALAMGCRSGSNRLTEACPAGLASLASLISYLSLDCPASLASQASLISYLSLER
jgi:hypothetical protein